MKKVIFIIFILSQTLLTAQSEKLNFYEIAFKTQQTLTDLADVIYPTQNVKLISSYSELEKTSSRLLKVLSDANITSKLEYQYLLTLKQSQEALDNTKNAESSERILTIFENINRDFENKLKSISFGISPNVITKAKIKVITAKDSGYSAYIKYTYDYNKNIIRLRFNNLTNDAERDLAPGYYIVWVEKEDYRSKDRYVDIVSGDKKDFINIIKF